MYKVCGWFLVAVLIMNGLSAQNVIPKATMRKAENPIEVDGVLNDFEWQGYELQEAFMPNFPNTTDTLLAPTRVYMTYDDDNLYIGAFMKRSPGATQYNVQSLERDFDLLDNEALLLVIDTYADYTNGYYFEVSPYGNKGESLAANSGRFQGVNTSWEKPWTVKTQRTEEGWSAEFAIPFRILKYRARGRTWRMNFVRIDKTNNQYSSWCPVPQNFDVWDLNFTGDLVWEEDLPVVQVKPNVLPSITGSSVKDFEADTEKSTLKPSLDLNIGLGQSLNLDLTLNPDFSQAEVDRQQINIGRFELFFPERRQFFIENEDLFSSYGFIPLRPFFSRRIGLAFDPGTGTFRNTNILGGLRLSGKLNDRLRVGLLSVQTAREEAFFEDEEGGFYDLPATNYSVLSLQQQFKGRSNIKFLFSNKELSESGPELNKFNRTLSLQYNFTSPKGRFYGWAFGSGSLSEKAGGDGLAYGSSMVYNVRKWRVLFSGRTIGRQYNAETGFVRRKGVSEFYINPAIRFYPKSLFAESRIGLAGTIFQDERFRNLDNRIGLFYQSFFKNGNGIRFQYNFEHTRLRNDFDPAGINEVFLNAGSEFSYQYAELAFTSNRRASFWYEFDASLGDYFNGSRVEANVSLNYRFQPYVNLNLRISHVRVALPAPYSTGSFNVITPGIRTSLSKSLFIHLIGQYARQFNNVNLNMRLQWRFKPVSDIFLIYAANHTSDTFSQKQRSLTLKINYLL